MASNCCSISFGVGKCVPMSSIQRLIDDLVIGIRNSAAKRSAMCRRLTPAHHREVTGQPDHTVAHMLGGRDTLDVRGEVYPLVLAVQVGPLRDDEPVLDGIVERRQFMYIDLVGFLAPTERRLRPQFLLKVVFA